MTKISDIVTITNGGNPVEATILEAKDYSEFPAMQGKGTMYLMQSEAWFGNSVWVKESEIIQEDEKIEDQRTDS